MRRKPYARAGADREAIKTALWLPGHVPEGSAGSKTKPGDAVAIVSYDEKPGIQAIATTGPDLPPEPGRHATFARDHEYKRHGTVSLLAGIDLLTGAGHALVKDRHRSSEFIEFHFNQDPVVHTWSYKLDTSA